MDKFRATTNIRHIDSNGTERRTIEIPKGAVVEGLSGKDMKALWDAGALEKVDDTEAPKAKVTSEPVNGTDTDGAEKTPAAPSGESKDAASTSSESSSESGAPSASGGSSNA